MYCVNNNTQGAPMQRQTHRFMNSQNI